MIPLFHRPPPISLANAACIASSPQSIPIAPSSDAAGHLHPNSSSITYHAIHHAHIPMANLIGAPSSIPYPPPYSY